MAGMQHSGHEFLSLLDRHLYARGKSGSEGTRGKILLRIFLTMLALAVSKSRISTAMEGSRISGMLRMSGNGRHSSRQIRDG